MNTTMPLDETEQQSKTQKIDTLIGLSEKLLFKRASQARLISEVIFKLSDEATYQTGIAYSHLLKGAALFYGKDFVGALSELERSEYEFSEINAPLAHAWVTLYMGVVNSKLEREHKSKQQLSQALQAAENTSNTQLEAATNYFIGLHKLSNKEFEAALKYLDKAYRIAFQGKHSEWIFQIAKSLSTHYKKQNQTAKSLSYYETYHKYYVTFQQELGTEKSLDVILECCLSHEHKLPENMQLAFGEIKQYNALYKELNLKCALIEEQKDHIKMLERQIREDPLTGLQNRRYLDLQLSLEFERARRYGNNLTLVMADIDHFKNINDTFSHLIGDKVLKEIAKIFRRRCRRIDIIARYGGEEFVLLLPMTGAEKAYMVCERIRIAIENYNWSRIYPELTVTISMGISDSIGIENNHDLLAAADKKLYEAKNTGRNRICY